MGLRAYCLDGCIGIDLNGPQTLVATTRIFALSPVAIFGMVAHGPIESTGRPALGLSFPKAKPGRHPQGVPRDLQETL